MDWRYESLAKELLEKCNFNIENLCELNQYDSSISHQVLIVLLQWACYGQNEAGILLGRSIITEIPRQWLKKNLLNIVKHSFDYSDDWNYRRLLELVVEVIPENKNEFIELNYGTTDLDLKDVIDDFK